MSIRATVPRLVATFILIVLGASSVLASVQPTSAATLPVSLRITRFVQVDDPDPAPLQGDGDYYAKVTISNLPTVRTVTFDDNNDFEPDLLPSFAFPWIFGANIDELLSPVIIRIEVFDSDGFGAEPDDVIDLNPIDGVTALTIAVDLKSGEWAGNWTTERYPTSATGDGDTEHFGSDEGGERGQIFFSISTLSTSGDADGDGLLDGWELHGLDADGDGDIDVDLPAMGANPLHKDLFVEYDWMAGRAPTRQEIQAVKDAFAAAPIDAGRDAPANPDGQPGINLWIDTGGLIDGDGNLIGDNFGGGNRLVTSVGGPWMADICKLNSSFYDAKRANFDPDRRWVFRYGIGAMACPDSPAGQAEVGGNDFVNFGAPFPFSDQGIIMHEFGHTLNLRHGGDENHNCKPNYVSVMNYVYTLGISQPGNLLFDLSPPSFSGGRGVAPLPTLRENDLDESLVLDSTDPENRFFFIDGTGGQELNQLNEPVDWNDDGDTNDSGLSVNIDTSIVFDPCKNNSSNSTLTGYDDWSNIILPIRPFGDSDDAALNLSVGEPTAQELLELAETLPIADLSIEKLDDPDPVAAGSELSNAIVVTNHGPASAGQVQVTDTLPANVRFVSASAGCTESLPGVVTCDLGELPSGEIRELDITVLVDADLVYNSGGPSEITNAAKVRDLAESDADPNTDNNTTSETTSVIAEADLEILSFTAIDAPVEALIGEPVEVELEKVITNNGPSGPMDVAIEASVAASAGVAVTPDPTNPTEAMAVMLGEERLIGEAFMLECLEPGAQTIDFENMIQPLDPADRDPDPSNNVSEITLAIDCVVPVAINIKPGSFPNPVNLKSNGNIPVAVLTTGAGEYGLPLPFNASEINPLSVIFGRPANVFNTVAVGAPESHQRGHVEDAYELDETTLDGDLDTVLHFRTQESGLLPGDEEACVKGKYTTEGGDRFTFFGCDAIVVVQYR